MKQASFNIIVAVSSNFGIGKEGKIPWHLTSDLKYFKTLTEDCSIIMGKNTFLSLPNRKPLPNRNNIVISKTLELTNEQAQQIKVLPTFEQGLEEAWSSNKQVWIIGGENIYEEALSSKYKDQLDSIYVTRINSEYECDKFWPGGKGKNLYKNFEAVFDMSHFQVCHVSKSFYDQGFSYDFVVLQKHNSMLKIQQIHPQHEEFQYLQLIKEILETGVEHENRTGTNTKVLYGKTLKFDISQTFPLLTTKSTFFRGIAEELIWFLNGCTDSKELAKKNVHIWDANSTKQFLEKQGIMDREEGDCGPIYGFQWRHFGAEYTNCQADYTDQGIDQLKWLINEIKTNPQSRRLIMSAWNPVALPKMALPPCHVLCQFLVHKDELSCVLYQRSADMGLGVPFNIASYSLLTHIIAKLTNLKPKEFIHFMADCHVYVDHIEKLQTEQLGRIPRTFPILSFERDFQEVEELKYEHLKLTGYSSYPAVKMNMSV